MPQNLKTQENQGEQLHSVVNRCAGSHLARREVIAAITEWLARVPQFRVKDGTAPVAIAGTVFGMDKLEIAWD